MNMPLKFLAGALVIAAGAWTFSAMRDDTVIIDRPLETAESSSTVVDPPPSSPAPAVSSSPRAETPPPAEKPGSVKLEMPFASQAPLGDWNPPYDEACEEASLIIVRHYLEGTALDSTIMNREILDMVEHEESEGLPIDIDMHELASVAKSMFGYDTEVVEGADVTIERIEQELAKGNPVILPLSGQDIGNPYYSGDGPPYHVLVVVGYDANNFVTHDVGTKRGEYYSYRKSVLMSAIHDWNGSVDTIRSGPKRMLVVTK